MHGPMKSAWNNVDMWRRRGVCSISKLRLLDLPKDCLVRIASFLNPTDACRLALVSRNLREAADSEEAWEQRLPKGYSYRIEGGFASKKDLFFRLRSGMLLRNGTETYWLDPGTGEGCSMKSARALFIVWGDDRRYWHWVHRADSWFKQVAYLRAVCWFEVRGEFESMFQPGAYTVSFRICMDNHTQGWMHSPVKFVLSTSNGHHVESQRFLQGDQSSIIERSLTLTSCRSLGTWIEYDAGEVSVEGSEMLIKLQFTMIEIDGGSWKSGLVLDGVKIQPSSVLREAPPQSISNC